MNQPVSFLELAEVLKMTPEELMKSMRFTLTGLQNTTTEKQQSWMVIPRWKEFYVSETEIRFTGIITKHYPPQCYTEKECIPSVTI